MLRMNSVYLLSNFTDLFQENEIKNYKDKEELALLITQCITLDFKL